MAASPALVDDWLESRFIDDAAGMAAILAANAAAGLPAIDVSPLQGRLLELFARLTRAQHILEIGTLGGYSTAWLARGLTAGGRIISLELDPHHAEIARVNLTRAGYGDRVEVRVGAALQGLEALAAEGGEPVDLAFIDADKANNLNYLRAILPMMRMGGLILCDNVVRDGAIIDPPFDDSAEGARAVIEAIGAEPRLLATAIQTVGVKGWDGLAVAMVL